MLICTCRRFREEGRYPTYEGRTHLDTHGEEREVLVSGSRDCTYMHAYIYKGRSIYLKYPLTNPALVPLSPSIP